MGDLNKKFTVFPVSVIDCNKVGKTGIRKCKKDNKGKTATSRGEFSPFPMEVGILTTQLHLQNCNLIFDPFSGWGERHLCCKKEGLPYIGYDKSPEAIKYALEKYGVNNILADSLVEDIPTHSGLLTCPPYFNLEKYQGDGLSSIKTWDEFIIQYKKVFLRCSEKATKGAIYCIMVGDFRKKGIYYNLSYETEKMMNELGFATYDKVIVSQKKTTPYLRMIRNCSKFLYSAKVHQYLLIFKKG
jgi:DNA modification methylase